MPPTGDKKGILLDIDGILVKLLDHFGEYGVAPRLEEEIQLVEGPGKYLDDLVTRGYVILCHTNQPDIARRKITQEFLEKKHAMLLEQYPQIKKIYICPHTETDLCDCRKPKAGLLKQAGKEFGLDFALSWVIGDSRGDVEAGTVVHAKTIFVQTQYNCTKTAIPAIDVSTAVAKDTKGALSLILALEDKASNLHDL